MVAFSTPYIPDFVQFSVAGTYAYKAKYTGWHFVQVIGAAGGGAGSTSNVRGAGGGGGGEYRDGWVYLIKGSTYNAIVGAAGTGGAATANGVDGGASSFASLITSNPGIKGLAAGTGGAGGTAGSTDSSVRNPTNYDGGAGSAGAAMATGIGPGGGGGGAGTRLGPGGAAGAAAATGTNSAGGSGGGAAGSAVASVAATGSSQGGFPYWTASVSATTPKLNLAVATIYPGITAGTTMTGVNESWAWGMMPIGVSNYFFSAPGKLANGLGANGGFYGGGAGAYNTGVSNLQGGSGGPFGGGGGSCDNNGGNPPGTGGLCAGGAGGSCGVAVQQGGADGGGGYICVYEVESPI